MISKMIDKLGEWNPQIFRELKGRLKTRNLTIAAGDFSIWSVAGISFLSKSSTGSLS